MIRAIVRVWTLLASELIEVFRQPMLMAALVLGPFAILVVFALGHRSQPAPMTVVLVVPSSTNLPRDQSFWRDRFGGSVQVVAVSEDEAAARAAVVADHADLALIVPASAATDLSSGKQVTIQILYNQINPADQAYTGFIAYLLSSELNKQIITEAARQAQVDISQAHQPLADLRGAVAAGSNIPIDRIQQITHDLDLLDQLSTRLQSLAPGLVAAPLTASVQNVASSNPGYVAFYTPGVLALLLQHMAITLAALSFISDRLIGMTELYKVAPVSTFSILFGKYVSNGILCMGVGAALTFLLVRVFGVPMLGDPILVLATAVLLVFASLGIGFTFSMLSRSMANAVQLTMLVLLASVFFSGFFIPINVHQSPATEVGDALPVTHAIVALQDLMLRGALLNLEPLYVIGGIGLLFLVLSSLLVRRELRRS